MIKTIIAGEALTRALERQHRWLARQGDDGGESQRYLDDHRRTIAHRTETLRDDNAQLRRRLRTKADVRSNGHA